MRATFCIRIALGDEKPAALELRRAVSPRSRRFVDADRGSGGSRKAAELSIRVRFLHLVAREGSGETWQEAIEREVAIASMDLRRMITNPVERSFAFDSGSDKDGEISRRRETVHGAIEVQTFEDAESGLFKVRVSIFNRTPADAERMDRNEVLLRSMVSTHTILNVRGGEFASLLDPPENARELAAACRNTGTWPVMAGIDG